MRLLASLPACILLAVANFGSSPDVGAAVTPTPDRAAARSERLLVHARVQASRTGWDAARKLIITETDLEIVRIIAGTPRSAIITVRHAGGRVGDEVLTVIPAPPALVVGEEAIVDLDARSGGYVVRAAHRGTPQALRTLGASEAVRGGEPEIAGTTPFGFNIIAYLADSTSGPWQDPRITAPFIHWDLRELPDCRLPWSYCAAGAPAMGVSVLDRLRACYAAWAVVEPARIGFVEVPGAPGCGFGRDGWNMVRWETSDSVLYALGVPGGTGPDSLGYVRVGIGGFVMLWSNAATGALREADVILCNNPSKNFTWVDAADGAPVAWAPGNQVSTPAQPGPFEVDLRTVFAHELGHVLGFHHNSVDQSLMNLGPIYEDSVAQHQPGPGDRDGLSFLYSPDLGDAPGPFPSAIRVPGAGSMLNGLVLDAPGPGAVHQFGIRPRQPGRNFTYEWLGVPASASSDADAECAPDTVQGDGADDGLELVPDPPIWGKPLAAKVWAQWANDASGTRHAYTAARPLWMTLWNDVDQDGAWETSEAWIDTAHVPAALAGANTTGARGFQRPRTLPRPPDPTRPMWMRARLDWAEHAGAAAVAVDPGLDGPLGAAHSGEVEDHALRGWKRWERVFVQNATGQRKRGLVLTYAGRDSTAIRFGAAVDAGGCTVDSLTAGQHTETYASGADETAASFQDPGNFVENAERFSAGRAEGRAGAQGLLRARWIPFNGSPGVADDLPVVNANLEPAAGAVRVRVGCVNASIGGGIATLVDSLGTWRDSIHVTIAYRAVDTPLSLGRLSLCDSVLAAAPVVAVGAAWITPARPRVFDVPVPADLDAARAHLVLDVTSSWTVNPSTTRSLIAFERALPLPVLAVDPPSSGRRFLGVEVSPHPLAGPGRLRFTLARAATVEVVFHDVLGRRVRTLARGVRLGAGPQAMDWDGADDHGRALAHGVFTVTVRGAGELHQGRVIVLR